jgi:cell division protein FtsB
MKLFFAIALASIVLLIGVQIFSFLQEQRTLSQNLEDVNARLTTAKTQEANLQEQMQYLSNPANLEKELRAQFNYKKPGETMIIIVSPQASSTP